jgi:hypothetical protein
MKKITEIQAIKGVTPWNGRYYLKSKHYLKKADAFFSVNPTSEKYVWKVDGGFVSAKKTYNGAVEDEIIELFGEILEVVK